MNGYLWLLLSVHVLLSLVLVLLVLIQDDKGGGLSGAFGGMGGGGAAFSGVGVATFISKLTRWVAFAFMAVVLVLNIMVSNADKGESNSVLKKAAQESGLGSVLPSEEALDIDSTLSPSK